MHLCLEYPTLVPPILLAANMLDKTESQMAIHIQRDLSARYIWPTVQDDWVLLMSPTTDEIDFDVVADRKTSHNLVAQINAVNKLLSDEFQL